MATPHRPTPPHDVEQSTTRVRVRRAVRIPRFLVLGGILGAIVALVSTLVQPDNGKYTQIQVFGFLALFAVPIGILLGGLVAVILDAIITRRAVELDAEHEAIPTEADDEAAAFDAPAEFDERAASAADTVASEPDDLH